MKARRSETMSDKKNLLQKLIDFVRGTSLCARIFAVVSVVFFLFGICTIGSLNGTGKSTTVGKNETVIFAYDLYPESDQSLAEVYVNVGAVYAPVGSATATDSVQISGTYVPSSGGSSLAVGTIYVHDIYTMSTTATHKGNANYNWVLLGKGHYDGKTVLLTFNKSYAPAQINEVAFVDEAGELIEAKVNLAKSSTGVSKDAVAATLDAQGSFHKPGSAYYDFSQAEEYVLNSVYAVRNGGEWLNQSAEGKPAAASTDYNSFGILIYTLSTLIFGMSTFGLRLPSFLASFATFLILYFFGKKLFRGDKWGLILSTVFGIGGTFFTVGCAGTPMALAVLAVVGCIYAMYLFYANGIDQAHPVRSALPVLFSGLCFSVALAVYTPAALPCVLALVLFAFGMVRFFKANRSVLNQISKKSSAVAAETDTKDEEALSASAAESAARAGLGYRLRLIVVFFLAAFVGFPVILLTICGIPTYYAFATAYLDLKNYSSEVNYLTVFLQKGLEQCFTIGDVTSFSAGNASSVGTWLLSLSGATVYAQSYSVGEETLFSQVNVQPNLLMTAVAAISLVFTTAYVIRSLVVRNTLGKEERRKDKNVLRIYIGLLVGAAVTFLTYLIISLVQKTSYVSAEQSYLFELFYLSFIVLALYVLDDGKAAGRMSGLDVVTCVLFALFLLFFIFASPMYFGWGVSEDTANAMYNWTAVLSNGNYGLLKLNR